MSDPRAVAFLGGPIDGRRSPFTTWHGWKALDAGGDAWLYHYRGRWLGDAPVFELDPEDAARWPWHETALLADRGDVGVAARRELTERAAIPPP